MLPSRTSLALATVLATITVGAFGGVARAHEGADFTEETPPELAGIGVDEKLGAQVPLDLQFRDQDGTAVTLAELIKGDVPVVLTLNYSNCTMLCSMMLDGVVDVLPKVKPLAAGEQFRMITVIIEPSEATERAAATRTRYLEKLEKKAIDLRLPAQEGGWTFLTAATPGDDTAIRALADAVGFRYHKAEDDQWAHPAVLIFLSPSGKVTRYVHGAFFEPADVTSSIVRAGISEPSGAVGFVQRCFHYDPNAHSYARTGLNVMKFTAAVFATMVIGALVLAHLLRRHARKGVVRP